MNSYSDSLIAKNLLLQLEFYVKNLSKRGPTDLTLYIENFAAKLMEIYYGYSFLNMNYVSKNIAEIDLLNYNKNHAIQITIENNNSSKIIKSIRSANKYDKVTVLFFNHNNVKTVVSHVKEKGEWKDNVEVISMYDIFSLTERDANKAREIKELCSLWIDGNTNNYTDLIFKFNQETQKRIEANIRSKKYIPEIYIPEYQLKKACRSFVDPFWSEQLLLEKARTYYAGYCYNTLIDSTVELKDGSKVSFIKDCDISNYLSEKYPLLHIENIIRNITNFMKITESVKRGSKFYVKDKNELSIDERYANLEYGINFTISHDLKLYDYSNKKFFFIVKDAGQGKTNFLCDFCKNVLIKRNIPSIYLNVNELTKNLSDTVCDHISSLLVKNCKESLKLFQQYCSASNKYLIICLDGLNENNNLCNFKNEVLELFRFADRYDFIKIIATSRNKAYYTYFKDFNSESFGNTITENIEEYVDRLGRKSDEFKSKIFSKYRNYFNISCYISSDAKCKLVNDTLLLRLFCEVYEGNTDAIINDIFLYELFSNYIKKRSHQLLKQGKIKRVEDLYDLLIKISKNMLVAHNLNEFSYEGFRSEEKDLIDLIVQEDIIIKTSDENGINLFDTRTAFSFTYDEFRDFLLASVILSLSDTEFKKEVQIVNDNFERYDGVLKFLFIFCKSKKDSRISILESLSSYKKIYAENIFSIEDKHLSPDDIKLINNALKNLDNKWVYYNIIKRLDVSRYCNLSVKNIVDTYTEKFFGNILWERLFVDLIPYSQEESGLLPDLLNSKTGDTQETEVYGILLLLSTISVYCSKSKEEYLSWLRKTYPDSYEQSLKQIAEEYKNLSFRALEMLQI